MIDKFLYITFLFLVCELQVAYQFSSREIRDKNRFSFLRFDGGNNVEDNKVDNVDEEKSWAEKLFDAAFFYGLDTPKRSRGLKNFDKSKINRDKLRSPFFTVGEQIGLAYLKDYSGNDNPDNQNSNIIESRMKDLDEYIDSLIGDIELIDAELSTASEDISDENKSELVSRREKLVNALNYAKVEYVNLCAEIE